MLVTSKGKELFAALSESSKQISALTEQQVDFRKQSRTYEATDLAFGPKEEQAIREMADTTDQFEGREDQREMQALQAERATEAQANFITFLVVICGFCIGARPPS